MLDGLRRVIAMQYANPPQPTLTFFPAVLKTLSNPYPSTRPLVYNYLLHHAEGDPDTALLSINTIQKSLSDPNARIRAMALKTMSGIRVPVISQIVSLAVKKGISDLSPLVRKAAALACVKCVRLDSSTRPQVEEYISTLLADKQYYVVGAAAQAFVEVCPDRLDLLHPVYRRLCRMIVDMDEWGQLAVLKLLTVYARQCFPQQRKRVKKAPTREEQARDFYEDLEPRQADDQENENEYQEVEVVDSDLELLLSTIQTILHSRNSAVVVAVARTYLYLSPTKYLKQAIGPLIALLRSPQDIQQVALYDIVQVCMHDPALFVPYVRHFLVRSTEGPTVWRLKLEILTLVFPFTSNDMQNLILAELEHFSHGHDVALVRESVRALGRCAQYSAPQASRRCLSLLLKQIHSADQHLVGEAIEVVRHLIQRDPGEHRKTVIRLAKNLDTLTSPTARASITWLVGEFAGLDSESNIAADVLRILVKGYADESDEVRAQIVLLSAKVYLHHLNLNKSNKSGSLGAPSPTQDSTTSPIDHGDGQNGVQDTDTASSQPETAHPIELLYQHTMLLARYTPSYDLRDRARTYRALLAVPSSTELASLLLLAPKPVPHAPTPSESRKGFPLGSASLVVGETVTSFREVERIPEWVVAGLEPDPKLRDELEGSATEQQTSKALTAGQVLDEALAADPGYKSTSMGDAKKEKSLEAWLDEEEEEESESADSEETESEDDEEEEEDGSEYETESGDDEHAGLVK